MPAPSPTPAPQQAPAYGPTIGTGAYNQSYDALKKQLAIQNAQNNLITPDQPQTPQQSPLQLLAQTQQQQSQQALQNQLAQTQLNQQQNTQGLQALMANSQNASAGSVQMPGMPQAQVQQTNPLTRGVGGVGGGVAQGGSQMGQSIASQALKWLGGGYAWGGGHTTNQLPIDTRVDCSGLVEQVYQDLGLKISGTAADMQQMGTPETLASAQPGDLVFYGSPAHHVGIYLGNGQMISAENPSAGIQESSVTGFGSDFSGIRRVF